MAKSPGAARGPDNVQRSVEMEHHLNECASICFRDKAGEVLLDHLRSITVMKAQSPPLDSLTLAHAEGARWLVAVLIQRIELGRKGLPPLEK